MDDAKNFLLSTMNVVRERIGNPIIGAFAFSWALWNFKIILVIFSSSGKDGWSAKIKYIYSDLMKDWIDWAIHGYIIPFFMACIWIFILPGFLRFIACRYEKEKLKTKESIYEVQKIEPLSSEEASALRELLMSERLQMIESKEKLLKSVDENSRILLETQNKLKESTDSVIELREKNKSLEFEKNTFEKKIEDANPSPYYLNDSIFEDDKDTLNLLNDLKFVCYQKFDDSKSIYKIELPFYFKMDVVYDGRLIFSRNQIIDNKYIEVLLAVFKYSLGKDIEESYPLELILSDLPENSFYMNDINVSYFSKYGYLNNKGELGKNAVFAGKFLKRLGFDEQINLNRDK